MPEEKTKVYKHTDIPTSRKAHKKEKTSPQDGTAMADSAATSVVAKQAYAETDWLVLSGVECKWIRVPPMIYNEASTRIRQHMRASKPDVPAITRDGNSPIPNPNDRYYIEAMEEWDEAYEDLEIYLRSAVPIMSGLILKEPVPDKKEWVPQLLAMLKPFGVTEDSLLKSPYMASEESLLELAYKKYVVLADPKDLGDFTRFQAGEDFEVSQAKAADMFRAN